MQRLLPIRRSTEYCKSTEDCSVKFTVFENKHVGEREGIEIGSLVYQPWCFSTSFRNKITRLSRYSSPQKTNSSLELFQVLVSVEKFALCA